MQHGQQSLKHGNLFFFFSILGVQTERGPSSVRQAQAESRQPILDISTEMELGQRENLEQSEGEKNSRDALYTSASVEEDSMLPAVCSGEGWCLSHVPQAFLLWLLTSESLWLRESPQTSGCLITI